MFRSLGVIAERLEPPVVAHITPDMAVVPFPDEAPQQEGVGATRGQAAVNDQTFLRILGINFQNIMLLSSEVLLSVVI
jgi:hypothetical protein